MSPAHASQLGRSAVAHLCVGTEARPAHPTGTRVEERDGQTRCVRCWAYLDGVWHGRYELDGDGPQDAA